MAAPCICRLFYFDQTELAFLETQTGLCLSCPGDNGSFCGLGQAVRALASWARCVPGADSEPVLQTLLRAPPGTGVMGARGAVHAGRFSELPPAPLVLCVCRARIVSFGQAVVGEDLPCPLGGL